MVGNVVRSPLTFKTFHSTDVFYTFSRLFIRLGFRFLSARLAVHFAAVRSVLGSLKRTISARHQVQSLVDLGVRGAGPPPLLVWVTKEEIPEGRKRTRPLPSSRSGSATDNSSAHPS